MPRFLFRLLTILLIPCFTIYSVDGPNAAANIQRTPSVASLERLPDDMPFSFDDIEELLEEIEEGNLEERCTPEQLAVMDNILAQLARAGLFQDESKEDLERDIEELLSTAQEVTAFSFAFPAAPDYAFAFAPFKGYEKFLPCKGFIHRVSDHAKHFVHKHKKAILIGVAVVTVAAVVAGVAVAIASAAAASAEAVASDKPSSSRLEGDRSAPKTVEETQAVVPIQAAVEKQVAALKEVVIEEALLTSTKEKTVVDNAREIGSSLAHQALDGVGELVAVVPTILEGIGNACFSDSTPSEHLTLNGTPTENYEEALAHGHKAIDQIFSTSQAPGYTKEAKDNRARLREELGINMYADIIPPPSSLIKSIAGKAPRIPATLASEARGWHVGQEINRCTIIGTVPSWNAVRRRYWKNQAYLHPERFDTRNLERARRGLAEQRIDLETGVIETKELHHVPPQREGGLFDFVELWPVEHAKADPFRIIGGPK